MNFQGNFRTIASVDPAPLQDLVRQLTRDHWTGDTTRQSRYEAHQATQAIGIVYDYDFRHTNPTRLPPYELFRPVLQPIFATVALHYESPPEEQHLIRTIGSGFFIRVSLVRLNPQAVISPHQDKNFSLAHSHRVHLPVITNDKVNFTVGSETRNMRAGELIEINNRRMHSVSNESDEGRVHLILDWVMPGEPCCCAAKQHPGEPCSPRACVETDRLNIPCNCYPEEPVVH